MECSQSCSQLPSLKVKVYWPGKETCEDVMSQRSQLSGPSKLDKMTFLAGGLVGDLVLVQALLAITPMITISDRI